MPRKKICSSPTGAEFSPCKRWRYLLWRRWDERKPAANFLMLNPSTADEVQLDPSCTRARVYAERWGFGALIVTNLFGWRATDPEEMKSVRDPVAYYRNNVVGTLATLEAMASSERASVPKVFDAPTVIADGSLPGE